MDLNTFSLKYIISMCTKEEEGESKFLKVEGVLILIGVVAETKKESSLTVGATGSDVRLSICLQPCCVLGFVACTEDMLGGLE